MWDDTTIFPVECAKRLSDQKYVSNVLFLYLKN